MRYVRLGKSNLEVSRLALDCHSQDIAVRTVHAALDAGITVFDTSPDAGDGLVESLLGEALSNRRQSILLASRISGEQGDQSAEYSLVASTRRLRTD